MYATLMLACWVSTVSGVPAGETRQLPPGDYWPRVRSEYEALERVRATQVPFREALPEFAQEFDALLAWMQQVEDWYASCTRGGRVWTEDAARHLVELLYVDHGEPSLNVGGQEFIVDLMGSMASLPQDRLPEYVRDVLTSGLVEYVQAGGGQYNPFGQTTVGAVLYRLSGGKGAAAHLAEELLVDAMRWADEVEDRARYFELVRRDLSTVWGSMAAWKFYDATLPRSALPPRPPKRYQEAVRKLAELLTEKTADEDLFLKHVRQATQAALEPYADVNLRNDLLCRLLIVYRTLLERQPPIPEKVSEYIQEQLARLAVGQRRLTTERHWEFWSDAAAAVGKVRGRPMSEPLREALLRAASDERTPLGARQRLELAFDLETLKSGPSSAPSAP